MSTGYGYVPPERPPQYGHVPSWPRRHKIPIILVAAGALVIVVIVVAVVRAGSSGPSVFLAANSSEVEFIQWQPDSSGSGIQGTIAYDDITGTAPSETVSVASVPFTGTINGSMVTLNVNGGFLVGMRTLNATLNGGSLSLSFIGSSGSIQTSTLTQSSTSAYNAAVAALHKRVTRANVLAAQVQAQAAQQQQRAQDQQTAQNDIATLRQDTGSFSGDLSTMANDVKQASKDLGIVQADAAKGRGSYCDNVYTVGDDTYTVDDDTATVGDDVYTMTGDFQTVHQDMATVNGDLQTIANDGGVVPQGASSALSAAHAAIKQAKATANGYIDQVDATDNQAFTIASGMATGSCSGQGPGSPGSLVPHIH